MAVDEYLDCLTSASHEENSTACSTLKMLLFTKDLRSVLGLAMCLGQTFVFSVVNFMNIYSNDMFVGFGIKLAVAQKFTLVASIMGITGQILGAILVDKLGRRPLTVGGGLIGIIGLAIVTTISLFPNLPAEVSTVIGVILVCLNLQARAGIATTYPVLVTEILPYSARAIGFMLASILAFFTSWALTLAFKPLINLHLCAPFVLLLAPSVLLEIYLWRLCPETKGSNLPTSMGEPVNEEKDYQQCSMINSSPIEESLL